MALDPFTIAVGAQALGGIFGGKSDRKAAKKAAKENRRLEAITNLISIAGGQGPTGFGQEQAVGGSTLSDILSGGGQAAGALIQQQAQDKIAADAVTQKNKVDTARIGALESSALADLMRALNAGGAGGSRTKVPFRNTNSNIPGYKAISSPHDL